MKLDKRKLIGTIFGILFYSTLILFFTYAWYEWRSEDTNVVFTIEDNLNQTKCEIGPNVNVENIGPVLDYNDGVASTFEVQNKNNLASTFSLSLDITSISESLLVESFKYILLKGDYKGNNYETTGIEGNFSNFQVGSNEISTSVFIEAETIRTYKLIVYIDGNIYNNLNMRQASMNANLTVNCTEIGEVTNGIPITLNSTMVPVTIYLDPGVGYYQDANLTQQITKLSSLPTKKGYTFNSYPGLTDSEGNITASTTAYTEPTTITATFSANNYTITFDQQEPNTDTTGTTTSTVTYDQTPSSITIPSKSYTVTYNGNSGTPSVTSATVAAVFGGYYTEPYGGGVQYYDGDGNAIKDWDINSDTTLYAKWIANNTITLTTATRTGYTLNGWYTASSNGTKIGDAEDSYTPTENIILYAQWTGKTITITYNSNGGTGSMSNSTYKYGGSLSLPSNTFTKSCYNFTHWRVYRPADSKWYGCTDTSVTCTSGAGNTTLNWYSASEIKAYYQPQPGWSWATTSSTSNLTFYAQWSLAYNYSIANASGTITTCKNTLNESISAASTSYPIINTLRNASSDSTAATFNKNLTLNLNGHTIKRTTGTITVNSGISVTVNGSGSITSTSGNVFQNNGVLYLNSGNYYSTEAVAIRNMGDLTINNSIVYSTGNNATLWNGEDTSGSYNGRIWIENSTIYATHADAHTIRNWSNDTWPKTATTGVAHNCDPHTCTIHITGKTKISQGHTSQSSKYTIISDRGTVHASGNFTGYIYAASNIALNSNTTNAIFKIYGGNIYSPNGSGHYYTPANAATSRIDINDGVRVKNTPTDWQTLG